MFPRNAREVVRRDLLASEFHLGIQLYQWPVAIETWWQAVKSIVRIKMDSWQVPFKLSKDYFGNRFFSFLMRSELKYGHTNGNGIDRGLCIVCMPVTDCIESDRDAIRGGAYLLFLAWALDRMVDG